MDPFIYQSVLGGVVFLVGIAYAYQQGYLGLSGNGLRRTVVLFGGLFAIAAVQGWLEYAPMHTLAALPYDGPPLKREQIGTPLDYGIMAGYFLVILLIGTFFGQNQKDTKDFFFGGQRFAWWLIAFSLVATTIGSYSFVKYSRIAFNYGTASTQTYLNDWFWLPLLLFVWLPILYFSRLTSIPEYFERRFGRPQRILVTGLLLIYLIGYVGINLFTMGQALNILLGWPIFGAAVGVATISAIYVTFGGQTSVIMTDLFQGLMLLATGLVLVVLGADHLGGFDILWNHLPRGHRTAFPNFNTDPSYNAAGVYWQDGVANTAMFYFLNQGILMRFMAARTIDDGRKAAVAVLAILMPIAAVVVASGGWVGRSLAHAGVLPPNMDGGEVFFITAEFLSRPGFFGLIMASLTAALMSTVDSLVTAIAAIVVNDIYRPLFPQASETKLLSVARWSSVGVSLLGVALVPVFSMFDSIYAAHGAFTAAMTPPMVVTLLLGICWRRFTPAAATATLIGGSALLLLSIFFPVIITPFAHGIPAAEMGEGLLGGAKQYKYIRAFFGIVTSATIAVSVTFVTTPKPLSAIRGYVWGTVSDGIMAYKGKAGREDYGPWISLSLHAQPEEQLIGPGQLPGVTLSTSSAQALGAEVGDLLYVSDPRAWLGGLYSCHVVVQHIAAQSERALSVGPRVQMALKGSLKVVVQRLY